MTARNAPISGFLLQGDNLHSKQDEKPLWGLKTGKNKVLCVSVTKDKNEQVSN